MSFILFFLGLAFGSFANALVWRLHEKRDFVSERSECESCGHVLAWYDLIPLVSWLSLRGKCRYCKKPVSVQNPLAELAVAAMFAVSYLAWPFELQSGGEWTQFGVWLAICVVLFALFVYDLRWMLLPNTLNGVLGILSFIYVGVALSLGGETKDILMDAVLGVIVGGGLFWILFQLSQGKWIGGGDVKFGFAMGAILGPLGAITALLLSFYSAALFILPLLLLRRITRKSRIPFGPFLIAGFFVAQLWGADLRELYTTIFNL